MTIISAGNSYNISFIYNNLSTDVIAKNVIGTVSLSAGLTLNSIISVVGAPGPNPDQYTIGNSLPNAQHEIIVNVTVVTESQNLDVTLDIATDNPETTLVDNSNTKNLVTELNGILCSDISGCGGTGVADPNSLNAAVGDYLYYNGTDWVKATKIKEAFTPAAAATSVTLSGTPIAVLKVNGWDNGIDQGDVTANVAGTTWALPVTANGTDIFMAEYFTA